MAFDVLIFSAGLGTRLVPLTNDRPKALVEIGGKPLFRYSLERLQSLPVNKVFVNVHHFHEKMIEYIEIIKNDFQFNIIISDESSELLDTGGGIAKIANQISGNLLAFNVDVLFELNLAVLYNGFNSNGSDVQLVVKDRKTSRYLAFDDVLLTGWKNISTGEIKGKVSDFSDLYAFSGIQILSQRAIQKLVAFKTGKFSIIEFYLNACKELKIQAYLDDKVWFDVGKYDQFSEAKEVMRKLKNKGVYC